MSKAVIKKEPIGTQTYSGGDTVVICHPSGNVEMHMVGYNSTQISESDTVNGLALAGVVSGDGHTFAYLKSNEIHVLSHIGVNKWVSLITIQIYRKGTADNASTHYKLRISNSGHKLALVGYSDTMGSILNVWNLSKTGAYYPLHSSISLPNNGLFGYAVDMSSNGSYLAVGNPLSASRTNGYLYHIDQSISQIDAYSDLSVNDPLLGTVTGFTHDDTALLLGSIDSSTLQEYELTNNTLRTKHYSLFPDPDDDRYTDLMPASNLLNDNEGCFYLVLRNNKNEIYLFHFIPQKDSYANVYIAQALETDTAYHSIQRQGTLVEDSKGNFVYTVSDLTLEHLMVCQWST